jgi:hypothetical protein
MAMVHDFIYQSGFSVINVCNDCNVFYISHSIAYFKRAKVRDIL